MAAQDSPTSLAMQMARLLRDGSTETEVEQSIRGLLTAASYTQEQVEDRWQEASQL